ncbi:hypothetical protein [Bacillus taeanensis]|uniref:Uncharacterized protein n=1 Tax=Bacillus taeanensis TaxID=273032 RepID=A0A366Y1T4_9BACI|nr:hypothetical protein [Bacillus taeanensis]RBW71345.1 hypothetical protein DS031_00920 [Bacillus taeanensis]
MSDEQQFEKRMKKLKSSYHEMPSFSSIDKITKEIAEKETMESIHKISHKKKWFRIGGTAAAICIGVLLIMNTMFSNTDQFANESLEWTEEEAASQKNEAKENTMQTELAPPKAHQYDIAETDRPLIKVDTIQIEGIPEQKTFHLYKNEELGFSTYYPDDMIVGVESTEQEKSVTFFADFNEVSQKNTFIRFQLLPNHLEPSIESAANYVEAAYGSSQLTKKPQHDEFYLSEIEYEFTTRQANKVINGWISLFTHHNQIYILTVQYVPEVGEALEGRTNYILNQMVWEE